MIVAKCLRDEGTATMTELVHAIREYRKIAESKPLTLQGSDYAHAMQELNTAIDWAEGLFKFLTGGNDPTNGKTVYAHPRGEKEKITGFTP
jgi:hypothetical protein